MGGITFQRFKSLKVVFFTILLNVLLTTHYLPLTTHDFNQAWAQPIPPGIVPIDEDIRITRHNLSSSGLGDVKVDPVTGTSEVCVFCHTPHGASPGGSAFNPPLWNRNLEYRDTTGYVLYDQTWSFSFEGMLEKPTKPTGYSRLCLSCHDGVIAIGSVVNKPGSGGFQGTAPTTDVLGIGVMGDQPSAVGFFGSVLSGDTRVLGTNLQNDHPISFVYDSVLATTIDTELVDPGLPPVNLNAVTPLAPGGGYRTGAKRFPGDDSGENKFVQCTSCHNPHTVTYPKFLRAARVQDAVETGFLPCDPTPCVPGGTAPAGQIICLYCHSKPGWEGSTHDIAQVVRAAYPDQDDNTTKHQENYDFDGIHTVGEVACRNCHDPHTAQGAKRLHREGVDSFGGSSAIENTCFLCHSPNESAVPTTFLPASTLTGGDVTGPTNHRFCDGTNDPGFCSSSTIARIAPDIWTQFNKDSSNCLGGSGTGSGMCLQLTVATGHEPVFLFRSQEGVQMQSEGVLLTPINNEDFPGITLADDRHVECTDCHNPHQVVKPDPSLERVGGRLKGMKGVGIDVSGTRPIVVGRFGATDTDIDGNSANRDPYVYEICFRCHGNSYKNIFQPNRYPDDVVGVNVPAGFASYTSVIFSPRTDPQPHGAPAVEAAMSFRGFSNKWLEFNPESSNVDRPKLISIDLARFGQLVPSHTQQVKNPAYHPVVRPGRNRSYQLCNQLAMAFQLDCGAGPGATLVSPGDPAAALTALDNLTIQCTDCHNSDKYDAYQNNYAANKFVPITGLLGPLTESNRRTFLPMPPFGDVDPDLDVLVDYVTGRPTETTAYPSGPIGPHGSDHRRLLRANYETDILRPGRCFEEGNPAGCTQGDGYLDETGSTPFHSIAGGGRGVNDTHFQQFLLCFQCHDRRAFDPSVGPGSDQDRSWTRFFGTRDTGPVDSWWEGNLHMYHLRWSGALCHECHYNIHSNIEAANTIYGDGTGGMLPPDGVDDGSGVADGVINTHLINFAPTVEGTTGIKPIWFYDGTAFRCYMRCHNEVMDSCAYLSPNSGTPNARWCAGGRNPGTSG